MKFKTRLKKRMNKLQSNLKSEDMQPTKSEIDKEAEIISEIILNTWTSTTKKPISVKTNTPNWPQKITNLRDKLVELNNKKNSSNPKYEKLKLKRETKREYNKGRRKFRKLIKQFKSTSFKNWSSNIRKERVVARLTKILEWRNSTIGSL